jgi:hypothetical protein
MLTEWRPTSLKDIGLKVTFFLSIETDETTGNSAGSLTKTSTTLPSGS